jgi:type 1 glutamine amidotransferase
MKALLVAGDFWHAAGPVAFGVKEPLARAGFELDTVICAEDLPWQALATYSLVVLAREGLRLPADSAKTLWLTEEQEGRIESFVKSGGTLFVFHSGICNYRVNGPVHRCTGGRFVMHPADHAFSVVPQTPGHPITAGIEPFTVVDELYKVEMDQSVKEIFLISNSAEHGTAPSGWTLTNGKGRGVVLTVGHTREVIGNASVQKIIRGIGDWVYRRTSS